MNEMAWVAVTFANYLHKLFVFYRISIHRPVEHSFLIHIFDLNGFV